MGWVFAVVGILIAGASFLRVYYTWEEIPQWLIVGFIGVAVSGIGIRMMGRTRKSPG